MLYEIKCEKLIENSLKFHNGLNSVIGADDAHNSIGKSSILMLIDFAFGGDDFITKCDDIFKNVGHMEILITYKFDKEFIFIRSTDKPDILVKPNSSESITIEEFRFFLQEKYLLVSSKLTFRDCVSPFFRVYQKNNYNEKRPLDSFLREPWITVRKRILKLFNCYQLISNLEDKKKLLLDERKDIQGAFNIGVVSKITKKEYTKNTREINSISEDITELKNTFSSNVNNIKNLINSEASILKERKDQAFNKLSSLKVLLARAEENISLGNHHKIKDLNKIKEFFPEVDLKRLADIEGFHNGISKIMKDKLSLEINSLLESISLIKLEIDEIDLKLLKMVDSKEDSVYFLEKLLELDNSLKKITMQNNFYEQDKIAKENISAINTEIQKSLADTIHEIEENINKSLIKFINLIYKDHPIAPSIHFEDKDYKFKSGDDRGTGKGFANMLSLDLSLLNLTSLPVIAHDSLLFKNMDVPAFENLVLTYSSFKKQIFISVDEITKFSKETRSILLKSMIVRLDGNRVAFKKKWKISTVEL